MTKVFDKTTNQETDLPLPIRVIVDDLNDNAPQFTDPLQFTVPEKSSAGEAQAAVNPVVFNLQDDDDKLNDHVLLHRDSGGESECHRQRQGGHHSCPD